MSTPEPMSRERVKEALETVSDGHFKQPQEINRLIYDLFNCDAALRARVEELERELTNSRQQCASLESQLNADPVPDSRDQRLIEFEVQIDTLTAKLAEVERERDAYKQRELQGYPAEQYFQLQQQLSTLTRENERLREALSVYAHELNWLVIPTKDPSKTYFRWNGMPLKHPADYAQAALKETL